MNPLNLIPDKFLRIAAIIAVLALVAGLVAGYLAWHGRVFEQGVAQEKGRRDLIDAKNTIQAQAELAEANAKVKTAQDSLATTLAEIDAKNTELENAKSQVAALRADVRSGAVRLSIPIAAGSCARAKPVDGTGTAGGSGAEASAELLPKTADDLIELVTDANEEVRRTNECIDRYRTVKSSFDALSAKP